MKSIHTTIGGAGTSLGLILVLLGAQFGGGEVSPEAADAVTTVSQGGSLGPAALVGLIMAAVSSFWQGLKARDDKVSSEDVRGG